MVCFDNNRKASAPMQLTLGDEDVPVGPPAAAHPPPKYLALMPPPGVIAKVSAVPPAEVAVTVLPPKASPTSTEDLDAMLDMLGKRKADKVKAKAVAKAEPAVAAAKAASKAPAPKKAKALAKEAPKAEGPPIAKVSGKTTAKPKPKAKGIVSKVPGVGGCPKCRFLNNGCTVCRDPGFRGLRMKLF